MCLLLGQVSKRWKGRLERLGKINKGLLHIHFVQQPLFMYQLLFV